MALGLIIAGILGWVQGEAWKTAVAVAGLITVHVLLIQLLTSEARTARAEVRHQELIVALERLTKTVSKSRNRR